MAVIKEGAKAPQFKGVDQHGNTVSIADFKGKKLVLYFYPKDDTPGCTAQACNLRDNYKTKHPVSKRNGVFKYDESWFLPTTNR